MTEWGRHEARAWVLMRTLASVLAPTLVLAACTDPTPRDTAMDASSAPVVAPPTVPSTTAPPATVPRTTTPPPPPYSFDDAVPEPPLINTGTDYVAIVSSLIGYASWLEAHHPDPTLLDTFVAPGTRLYTNLKHDIDILHAHGFRLVEPEDAPREVIIGSVRNDLVSGRVVEHITAQKVVAPGRTVDERRVTRPITELFLIKRYDAQWYLAGIEPLSPPGEIRL